jgi:N-sulfoglucosamine sulfohydrolase
MSKNVFVLISACLLVLSSCKNEKLLPPPNILWLVSEDNSPMFGCYGDEFAITPNLDKLASEGFLYTHAYANAPVCAPARNTIISGVYASSSGNENMRSHYKASDIIRFYPEYFQDKGYYCTNNAKTDYNTPTAVPNEIWDESSQKAHYKNRKEGEPFFAVFNTGITHESSIHKSTPTDLLRHDSEKVPIAPYHPRTEEMKHDWAQYYDKMEDMDSWVGEKLKDLEDSGEAENTIVFYYGDHGGVLGRSKRFVYETGTRVPFIVRIPKKYKYLFPAEKPGDKVDRLISFVDLVPTLLSIIDEKIPDYLQGNAFLGKQKTEDPEYAYMFRGRMDERFDMCRAVRDKKYRYIRNYMPFRIYGMKLEYLWKAPSMQSWDKAYKEGKCNATQSIFWNTKPVEELYDTENDPWEINNLAVNPEYQEVLVRLRKANREWLKSIQDAGFIPEAEIARLSGDTPYYDYVRSNAVNMDEVIEVADAATLATKEDLPQLISYLQHESSVVRYWGATGLLILGKDAIGAKAELTNALNDESSNVKVVVAEILCQLGDTKPAIKALSDVIRNGSQFACTHAMNVVDCQNLKDPMLADAAAFMVKKNDVLTRKRYDLRIARMLFNKWGIDSKDYGIDFPW